MAKKAVNLDEASLDDIVKADKEVSGEEGQQELLGDSTEHSIELYNVGNSYLNKKFKTEKGKRKIHGISHLDQVNKRRHAKEIVKQFAQYLHPKVYGGDLPGSDRAVQDIINNYFVNPQLGIRNYQDLVRHIERTKNLRGDMGNSKGRLKQLFEQAMVRAHVNTFTASQLEEHYEDTKHYKALHKTASAALAPYHIALAEGTSVGTMRDVVRSSFDPKWKPTLDDNPDEYKPLKKRQ